MGGGACRGHLYAVVTLEAASGPGSDQNWTRCTSLRTFTAKNGALADGDSAFNTVAGRSPAIGLRTVKAARPPSRKLPDAVELDRDVNSVMMVPQQRPGVSGGPSSTRLSAVLLNVPLAFSSDEVLERISELAETHGLKTALPPILDASVQTAHRAVNGKIFGRLQDFRNGAPRVGLCSSWGRSVVCFFNSPGHRTAMDYLAPHQTALEGEDQTTLNAGFQQHATVCPALGELRLVNPQGPPPPASAAARAGAFTGSVGALSGSAGGAAASRRPREGQATAQNDEAPAAKRQYRKARLWTVAEDEALCDAIVVAQKGRQTKARWQFILGLAAFVPDATITADACQARFDIFKKIATLGDTLRYTALSDGLKKLWKESLPNEGKLLAALNARK
jgi:hypothetical protein